MIYLEFIVFIKFCQINLIILIILSISGLFQYFYLLANSKYGIQFERNSLFCYQLHIFSIFEMFLINP